jgi:phage/plasmid-like protein (TIGR03299 family)
MAHEISTVTGSNAFAYIDGPAWHGLGDNILKQMQAASPAERITLARQLAQLNYTIEARDIFLADGTKLDTHKATVRLDGDRVTPLSVVGKGYETVQNEQATEVLEVLAQEWGAVPATAGALGLGERAFMLMRLADATITPLPGDDVRGYFLLSWSHDGQTGVNGLPTAIRVVCANTLAMAMNAARGKAWFRIKHTSSAASRLDQAARLMGDTMKAMQAAGDTFKSMAQQRLGPVQLQAYIDRVIPNTSASTTIAPVIEARRATVAALVHGGRGAAMANQGVDVSDGGASLWAAYNAVTEYFDHVRPAEAKSDAGRNNAFESALFGGNAEIKAGALQLAAQLATAAVDGQV